MRMSYEQFSEILSRVAPKVQREDTNMRRAIPAKDKLELTLRYLASGWYFNRFYFYGGEILHTLCFTPTGETQFFLSRQFRVSHSSVNCLLAETCQGIYEEPSKEFISLPRTDEDWTRVMRGFGTQWQFPNCVGAMTESTLQSRIRPTLAVYFNYKKRYSVILFAMVDSNYKFLYIDVGTAGSDGDAGIWQTTFLQKALQEGNVNLPKVVTVSECPIVNLPAILIGDDAFPLSPNLMKPYPGNNLSTLQRVFNYS